MNKLRTIFNYQVNVMFDVKNADMSKLIHNTISSIVLTFKEKPNNSIDKLIRGWSF